MTPDQVKRKLVAILSADVQGYSRLMGEDEEWTLRMLNTCKKSMADQIQQFRGRIVGAAGDSLLVEFVSVVDAVQCALEIQQVIRAKNIELPENRRMEFRIGINLGDVIEEGDTIYGDGVNIAARLEGLAEGGGICLSRQVFDQVKNKIKVDFDYLGAKSLKNISEPVYVYKVLFRDDSGVFSSQKGPSAPQRPSGIITAKGVSKKTITGKSPFRETFPEIRQILLKHTPEAFASAFSLLKEELKKQPTNPSAQSMMAYILWKASNHGWLKNLGIGYFESRLKARLHLQANRGEASPWSNIIDSEIMLLRRDFPGAVKLAGETLDMSPADSLILSWLAYVLVMSGRPLEAITYGQEAVRNDPDHPALHYSRLALAYLSMGQIREAMALYEKAGEKNPLIENMKAAQAVALFYSGKQEDSRNLLDQYKTIWPVLPNLRRVMFFWPFQDVRMADFFASGLIGAKLPGAVSDCLHCLKDSKLNGNTIRSVFFGKNMMGFDPWTGRQEWVKRDRDGKAILYGGQRGQTLIDTGQSRVEKDNLCDCWEKRTAGIEVSSPVFRNTCSDLSQKEEYILFTDYGFMIMSPV